MDAQQLIKALREVCEETADSCVRAFAASLADKIEMAETERKIGVLPNAALPPKAVSEWEKGRYAAIDAAREAEKIELDRRKEYVSWIVAKDIPVYRQPSEKMGRARDYSNLRKTLRKNILEGRGCGFIELACDNCGTRLFDSNAMTLSSSPPQFYADCCGCGRRYYLTLDSRAHVF